MPKLKIVPKKPRFGGGHLAALGFASYADYLNSPLWAGIRSRVYAAKGRMCTSCKTRKATQIHHERYDAGTMAGETIEHLRPVCRACHRQIHGLDEQKQAIIITAPDYYRRKRAKARRARPPKKVRKQPKRKRRPAPAASSRKQKCSVCLHRLDAAQFTAVDGPCAYCRRRAREAQEWREQFTPCTSCGQQFRITRVKNKAAGKRRICAACRNKREDEQRFAAIRQQREGGPSSPLAAWLAVG